jgi:hypothetical protein
MDEPPASQLGVLHTNDNSEGRHLNDSCKNISDVGSVLRRCCSAQTRALAAMAEPHGSGEKAAGSSMLDWKFEDAVGCSCLRMAPRDVTNHLRGMMAYQSGRRQLRTFVAAVAGRRGILTPCRVRGNPHPPFGHPLHWMERKISTRRVSALVRASRAFCRWCEISEKPHPPRGLGTCSANAEKGTILRTLSSIWRGWQRSCRVRVLRIGQPHPSRSAQAASLSNRWRGIEGEELSRIL